MLQDKLKGFQGTAGDNAAHGFGARHGVKLKEKTDPHPDLDGDFPRLNLRDIPGAEGLSGAAGQPG